MYVLRVPKVPKTQRFHDIRKCRDGYLLGGLDTCRWTSKTLPSPPVFTIDFGEISEFSSEQCYAEGAVVNRGSCFLCFILWMGGLLHDAFY